MQIAREQMTPDDRRVAFRASAATDNGTAVTAIAAADEIALPPAEAGTGPEPPLASHTPRAPRQWLPRLRIRRAGRGKVATGAASHGAGDVLLEIALLREENLRLKGECHRPADLGVLIGQLRLAAAYELEVEDPDEGWTLLAECHRVQEQLRQAQLEVAAAITTLEARLAQLDGAHLSLLEDGDAPAVARDAA